MRWLLALLFAPLGTLIAVPVAVVLLYLAGLSELAAGATADEILPFALFIGVAATFVAYAVMITLGAIALVIMRRTGRESLGNHAVAGAIVGALPFLFYFAYGLVFESYSPSAPFDWGRLFESVGRYWHEGLEWTVYGIAAGTLTSVIHWSLVHDRDSRRSRLSQQQP